MPALMEPGLLEAVQEPWRAHPRAARQRQRGARYVLPGLVRGARCGYAYSGKPISTSAAQGTRRADASSRGIGTAAYRYGGQRVCDNTQVRTDRLDAAVWREVQGVLEPPQHLAQA